MAANWFIALPVPADRWFEPLIRDVPRGVRVFHPADLHLTVAFLGACGPDAGTRAWETVARCEGPAMPVVLGGVAPMGNPKRPSALSVVIERGHEPVVQLIATLRDGATEAAGAPPERRPPLGHITVARPSRRGSPAERQAAIEWARSQRPVGAEITLDRLALFTWADDRRERQFRIVQERRLGSTRPSLLQQSP